MNHTQQRRRSGAAAACVALLAGCSGHPGAAPATPSPLATTSATSATASPSSAAALQRALSQTAALRSYSFTATQALSGGPHKQRVVLQGRVIRRPMATAYLLKVGSKSQQIVQVGGRTYRRLPPGPWRLLVKPIAPTDPLAGVLLLLRNLLDPSLTGSRLTGHVSAATLVQAHLAPGSGSLGTPAPVTLELSPDGHVAALALGLLVPTGSTTLQLLERTAFSGFDRAAAVLAPIRHR